MLTRLPVLMYHRVAPSDGGPHAQLTVPPEQFERQMTWLKRHGYHAVRQADLVDWLAGKNDLPARSVVITFDDGYADNVRHAFPVLLSLGLPAVTFIVTGLLGGTNQWDHIDGQQAHSLMTATEILDWASRGMEFGAHGRSHCRLSGLPRERLDHEIAGSGDDLARLVGQAPLAFCFPYGDHNPAVRRAAARHFRLAYGVTDGANRATADRADLRRTMVQPDQSDVEFAWQMRLGFNPVNRARHATVTLYRQLLGRG